MSTVARRFAWLPRDPQPTPLSDKAVQIVNILQRAPNGLTASEIVKKSGGTFLVNHVYVYLRRLQSRGIVNVMGPEPDAKDPSRQVLRAMLAPGQVVKRQKPGEAAQSTGSARGTTTRAASSRGGAGTTARRGAAAPATGTTGRRTKAEPPAAPKGRGGRASTGGTRRSQQATAG